MTVRMEALLAADPEFGLAHCLEDELLQTGYRADSVPLALAARAEAGRCGGSDRAMAHAVVLEHRANGDRDRAVAVWDHILATHPHDILAFRLAHFVNFWSGKVAAMLASVRPVEQRGSGDLPGFGSVLACRGFALEEAGHYLEAGATGRGPVCRVRRGFGYDSR